MNETSWTWLCCFGVALQKICPLDTHAIDWATDFADKAVARISATKFQASASLNKNPVAPAPVPTPVPVSVPNPAPQTVFDEQSAVANAAVDSAIRARMDGKKRVDWNARGSQKYDAAAEYFLQTHGNNARVWIVRLKGGEELEKGTYCLPDIPTYMALHEKISAGFWNGDASIFRWTIFTNGHQQQASDVMTFEVSIPKQQEYARMVAQAMPVAQPLPPPGPFQVPIQQVPPPGYPPPPFPPPQVPPGHPAYPYGVPFVYPTPPAAQPPEPCTVPPPEPDLEFDEDLDLEQEESEDEVSRWKSIVDVAGILKISPSGLRNRINRTLKKRKITPGDNEEIRLEKQILVRKSGGLWEARILLPWER